MPGYFSTLNTALKSLQVQKKSLDVTGHNIANANTEGYSRQRAVHTAADPYTVVGMGMPTGAGQVGTGVKLEEISRVRDQFIDAQINGEKQSLGYWDKRYQGLHRIELIFNEPSDSSLGESMNQFWGSLQDLSNDPEDPAVRETVKQRALTLSDTFHSLDNQLTSYKNSLNDDVSTMVNEVNSYATRIADLNKQIVRVQGAGKKPNDLMDKRDLLFEEMNKLVNVQGRVDQRGSLNISISGINMVSHSDTHLLNIERGPEGSYEDTVVFSRTGTEAIIEAGELAGVLNIRDEEIPHYKDQLDTIASELIENFNQVHRAGYDFNGEAGQDFFVGDDAFSIGVATEISNDVNKIAAGSLLDELGVIRINNFEMDSEEDFSYEIEVIENVMENEENTFTYTIREYGADGEESEVYTNTITYSQVNDENFFISLPEEFNSTMEFKIEGAGELSITSTRAAGDGDNAFRLADVINGRKLMNDGKATLLDYYKSTISVVGVDGQRANQMVDNQNVLVDQLNNHRISVSGVSLDEEMANMIQYQQAYTAATRVITTIDQMLDSLMGIIR
ncbi:flagellar hook-associated protein FlgK [Natronospora cellulosivora (SeqCode)]